MTPLPLIQIPHDHHLEEVMHHPKQKGNGRPGRPRASGQRMWTGLRTQLLSGLGVPLPWDSALDRGCQEVGTAL